MIRETIVTTVNEDGGAHIAPMGVREEKGFLVLAPFHPSATLRNLQRHGFAVVNLCDDVRIFADCLTGRRLQWPTRPASSIPGVVLEVALTHLELQVERVEDDELRPRFFCRRRHQELHAPFLGFNRAQAAVIEAAILVSRLHMLPAEKVQREVDYLRIAVEKTAGPRELEAWGWLMARIDGVLHGQGPN